MSIQTGGGHTFSSENTVLVVDLMLSQKWCPALLSEKAGDKNMGPPSSPINLICFKCPFLNFHPAVFSGCGKCYNVYSVVVSLYRRDKDRVVVV